MRVWSPSGRVTRRRCLRWSGACRWWPVLAGDVTDGDGLVTVRAEAAEVDAGAGPVAVVAPLLAELAAVAPGAQVDGDLASGGAGRDHDRWRRCWVGVAGPPGGLAAGVRAVALAADRGEGPRTVRAGGCRHVVVTPRGRGLGVGGAGGCRHVVVTPRGHRFALLLVARGGGDLDDFLGWVEVEGGEDVALGLGGLGGLPERAGRAGEGDQVQAVEVGADGRPGSAGGGLGDADEEQGQPAEQDVGADAVFEAVVDRAQVQDRLHVAPAAFDLQELLVAHGDVFWGQFRVRAAQQVLAVEACFGLDRGLVDA